MMLMLSRVLPLSMMALTMAHIFSTPSGSFAIWGSTSSCTGAVLPKPGWTVEMALHMAVTAPSARKQPEPKSVMPPPSIALEAETESVAADGEDLCYVNASVQDSWGRVVPTADRRIVFSIEGPGEIVATDNGDETDFDDFRQPRRKAFYGWAQGVIHAIPGAAGTIRVTAASGDLVPASLPVEARLPFAPQGGDSILYEEV